MPASLGLGGTAPLFTFIWRPIPHHHHPGEDDDDNDDINTRVKVLTFGVSQIACGGGVRLFARRTFTTPKFGHLPPPNSDIYHPPKKNICQEDNCHPLFFLLLFLVHFSWLFRLTAHGGHQGWEGGGA